MRRRNYERGLENHDKVYYPMITAALKAIKFIVSHIDKDVRPAIRYAASLNVECGLKKGPYIT